MIGILTLWYLINIRQISLAPGSKVILINPTISKPEDNEPSETALPWYLSPGLACYDPSTSIYFCAGDSIGGVITTGTCKNVESLIKASAVPIAPGPPPSCTNFGEYWFIESCPSPHTCTSSGTYIKYKPYTGYLNGNQNNPINCCEVRNFNKCVCN